MKQWNNEYKTIQIMKVYWTKNKKKKKKRAETKNPKKKKIQKVKKGIKIRLIVNNLFSSWNDNFQRLFCEFLFSQFKHNNQFNFQFNSLKD